MTPRLYLGTHRPHWLGLVDVPLFVSRRTLAKRKSLPAASAPWVLDSGGFTELSLSGGWSLTTRQYAAEVERYRTIGGLEWVAPMDWMCEPSVRAKTGLSTGEHQRLTVVNYLDLRDRLGDLVVPVLQGWEPDDYHRCVEAYDHAGVDLNACRVVGVGSVCRRNAAGDVARILRSLHDTHGLRLHGFGIKGGALRACSDFLESADSMAWSYTARRSWALSGCTHRNCANCLPYALRWRARELRRLNLSMQRLPLWESA